ncbi:uncharacterized protein [Hetaerina americana]|uniref:uncharacterized protein n=1 Tax=Hetaerina americana TaxID=62018 RepID=UPI003A7F2377
MKNEKQANAGARSHEGMKGFAGIRDKEVIPRFVNLRPPVNSPAARRIMRRTSLALLRERIHHHRSALDDNAKCLLDIHLRLAACLSPTDWDFIDRTTAAQGERLLRRNTERQKKKYERLDMGKEAVPPLDRQRLVINLTGTEIDESTSLVLAKGLNFAPTPRSIPYLDIVGSIEQAIRKLPQEEAEEVRGEVSMVLKRAVVPKPNITKGERRALISLRKNPDVTILPADKGNATVLLNTDECHQKIQKLLEDPAYRTINRDPTDAIVRKTSALIKKTLQTPEASRNLIPQAPVPPRLYGLPKVHKEGAPLRPIVSAIGAPTYGLARYLTGVLAPLVGSCEHHIKNSAEFVQTLKNIHLEDRDILVSFDVVSLFTKVPVKDTLLLLQAQFDQQTVELFRHVLTSTYFLYNGKFYEQLGDGGCE